MHVTDVTKSFGGIRALQHINLDIEEGEVHGLIGPNGSGKSTLMKIIAGVYHPDAGEIRVHGERLRPGVVASRREGITIVPQEICVVPGMTVEENIILGAEPEFMTGIRSRRSARSSSERILAEIGCAVDPTALAGDIVPSQRRLVMLAAALQRGARLVILDEPTAGLATEEAEHVLAAIRQLKASGRTVILVSHRLDDMIALSDRMSVLREGQLVAQFLDRRAERSELIELIAPTDAGPVPAVKHRTMSTSDPAAVEAPVVLSLVDGAVGSLKRLTLEVRRGESVGVVGGLGSGVREVAEALSGGLSLSSGQLRAGSALRKVKSVSEGLHSGLLFISGERHRFVIHDREVGFHVCLPSLEDRSRFGLVSKKREVRAAEKALAAMGVTASAEQPLASLSGGNQQRALFARAALGHPEVLVIYEPSVGVDVHGRELLRSHMRNLKENHGLVVVSSDPEEVVGVCDRVTCLRDGSQSAELVGAEVTVPSVLEAIS